MLEDQAVDRSLTQTLEDQVVDRRHRVDAVFLHGADRVERVAGQRLLPRVDQPLQPALGDAVTLGGLQGAIEGGKRKYRGWGGKSTSEPVLLSLSTVIPGDDSNAPCQSHNMPYV